MGTPRSRRSSSGRRSKSAQLCHGSWCQETAFLGSAGTLLPAAWTRLVPIQGRQREPKFAPAADQFLRRIRDYFFSGAGAGAGAGSAALSTVPSCCAAGAGAAGFSSFFWSEQPAATASNVPATTTDTTFFRLAIEASVLRIRVSIFQRRREARRRTASNGLSPSLEQWDPSPAQRGGDWDSSP